MSANPSIRRPSLDVSSRIAVLIPAYQPTIVLEDMVGYLVEFGVPAILIVDDGSGPKHQKVFERLTQQPCVHVLRHPLNRGKGAALKTGLRYFLQHFSHYAGLITADGDGQHSVDDVLRMARAMDRAPGLTILGARALDGLPIAYANPEMPKRIVMGNRVLAILFRMLTGTSLSDTQTGLRGLPTVLLPRLLGLPGNRYEYEMNVLMHIARNGHPLAEQPIRMISGPGVSRTHFRPVADSLRLLHALMAAPLDSEAPAEGAGDATLAGRL
jgi:glycosyltransferase involved in cell wall biosynthesis